MNKSDLRDTAIVVSSLLLATLTGFLRQSAIAYTLGVGREADIFLVAYAIPEFVYIALPIVLSPVLIPLFMQIRQSESERSAWKWGYHLSVWVMAILLALILGTVLLAPTFLRWLSPGFEESERQQALHLLYPMLPGVLLMGLSTLAGSVLQIYRRFARPAMTTAVYNLVFIGGLIWLPHQDPLSRTGWSVSMAAGAAFIFQLPLLIQIWRNAHRHNRSNPISKVKLREAFRLLGWMAAGYGVHHLILFIDRAWATGLGEGSVAILNYGYHIALVVGQVSGLAVSNVVFPTLVEAFNEKRYDKVNQALRLSLGLTLAIALPTGTLMIVLGSPLVRLLLEHGAFSSQATSDVYITLVIYTFAVTFDALCQPLWRLVYSSRKGWVVVAINAIQTITRIVANLILVTICGYNGLAWAAVIGLGIQLVILVRWAHSTITFTIGVRGWKTIGKLGFAILIAGLVSWLVVEWLLPEFLTIIGLILGGIMLVGVYGFLVWPLYRQTQWLRSVINEHE